MADAEHDILQIEGVTWRSESHLEADLRAVTLRAGAGDLLLLSQEAHNQAATLFDFCQGLKVPQEGRVLFDGQDWTELSPFDAARRRGRIGRTFESSGWISNLDVYENLALAQQHHTQRPEEAIREEVESLMRRFGFSAIPGCRPHLLKREEARRAQWVRALLGEPRLLLLESPTRDTRRAELGTLCEAIRARLEGGGAVVWSSDDPEVWKDLEPYPRQRRYDFRGDALEAVM